MIFKDTTWSIDIPENWHGIIEDNCWTFSALNEIGVLQISTYFKDELVTDQDINEFLSEYIEDLDITYDTEGKPKVHNIQAGHFIGSSIQYGIVKDESEDEQSWRVWWLRSGHTMLFVTYICANSARGVEDIEIENILQSLREETSPNK